MPRPMRTLCLGWGLATPIRFHLWESRMFITGGGSDDAHCLWASQSLRVENCPAAENILASMGFDLQCRGFPIFLTFP